MCCCNFSLKPSPWRVIGGALGVLSGVGGYPCQPGDRNAVFDQAMGGSGGIVGSSERGSVFRRLSRAQSGKLDPIVALRFET